MPTYSIEARGTNTRDVKWFEVDALSADVAKNIAEDELGNLYRVHAVSEILTENVDLRGSNVEVKYQLRNGTPFDFHLVDQALEYDLSEDEVEWIEVQLYAIHNPD